MNENKLIKLGVAGAVIVGIGVIGGFKFFEKIDNGYVGVRYSMNGGIKDEALTQGVKFVGIDKVINIQFACKLSNQKIFQYLQATAKRQRLISNMTTKLIQLKQQKCTRNLGISLRKISKVDG